MGTSQNIVRWLCFAFSSWLVWVRVLVVHVFVGARPLGLHLQSQQKPAAGKMSSRPASLTVVKAEEHSMQQSPRLGSCAGRHRLKQETRGEDEQLGVW